MKQAPHDIERQNRKFEEWRERNPTKSFKDYFAETVKAKLQEGKPHATLGRELRDGAFGSAGLNIFNTLIGFGLKPEDVCVDYGCGTLRIGIHVINYLGPGAYWGLDIADFLLEEGRQLLGEGLYVEKRPNLRVISAAVVVEAAAAKPAMLFSSAVLTHVYPEELSEFFGNVMTIVGPGAQAVFKAYWNDSATIQYSGRSWAHALPVMRKLIEARDGALTLMTNEEHFFEGIGQTAKKGWIRIARRA